MSSLSSQQTQHTCAAFTMARNEPLWLKVWLSHHSKELGPASCYVIHEPNDPTVDEAKQLFPGAQFVEEPSPKPGQQKEGFYDMQLELWRLAVVKRWQKKLLLTHRCVAFGDTDELLVPETGLIEFCEDVFLPSGADRIRSECWQPVQQPGEPPTRYVPGTSVLEGRSLMWRLPVYDKTLLVTRPMTYSRGFHLTYGSDSKRRIDDPVDARLPMLHMWRCDFDDWYQDAVWRYGCGREEGWDYFRTHKARWIVFDPHAVGEAVPVPEAWKQRLVT